jgi:hypothetical protein
MPLHFRDRRYRGNALELPRVEYGPTAQAGRTVEEKHRGPDISDLCRAGKHRECRGKVHTIWGETECTCPHHDYMRRYDVNRDN